MVRLYMLVAFFITIEIVLSGPLLKNNLLKRYDRRNMKPLISESLKSNKRLRPPVGVGRRGVVPTGTTLWPNGEIPYDLSEIKPGRDQEVIIAGMLELMNDTAGEFFGIHIPCITFREKTPEDEVYLTFEYGEGCVTYGLGLQPGKGALIALAPECFTTGTIQHELMHVLGFDHEMNRPDRDEYVTVYLDRVDPDFLEQYNKYGEGTTVDLLTPYDVNSIMHYNVFYESGKGPDMQSKTDDEIKPSERLSPIDVREVRTLYQCI